MQADLREKDLYISELEEELQENRKKISTLCDQLVQTEKELERLKQKSRHARQQCSLYKLISSPYKFMVVERLIIFFLSNP